MHAGGGVIIMPLPGSLFSFLLCVFIMMDSLYDFPTSDFQHQSKFLGFAADNALLLLGRGSSSSNSNPPFFSAAQELLRIIFLLHLWRNGCVEQTSQLCGCEAKPNSGWS
jgi:hypothetical protein